jgi:hypothetical protein
MPLSILQQATKRSEELMNTNNATNSRVSDQLYAVLEAGEWSTEIRDLIDQTLHNFSHTRGVINPNYDRNELRKFMSIKEKIAYINAGFYTQTNPRLTTNDLINDTNLRQNLDEVIQFLEYKLISNREFSESWMLRNAAFNRFEPGMNAKESTILNNITSELRKLCETNNFENLAQSTHFTKESDAQKIMKLGQIAKELSSHGINIPETILSQLEEIEKKIEPLKKLDRNYKHMINMLNMIHSLPVGYPSMINQNEQRKLIAILQKLEKKESDFMLQPLDATKRDEFATLQQKLKELMDNPQYKTILEEMGVHQSTFEQRFLVYFTYKNSEKAKSELDDQKTRTFGNKAKDYEQDHQQRRGRLRNRIFEIGERMTPIGGNRWRDHLRWGERFEFADDQDYELANSYFSKFQNLFFVNERDAYNDSRDNRNMRNLRNRDTWQTPIENHYLTMRNTIAAILRKRMPALATWSHDRHGSFPRKMYKWLEWFLKGQEEKWFFKMIKRTRHNADHAEMMAMMIMLNNQQQQKMFHTPKDPFKHNDSFFGKMFKGLHLTERYRQNLGKKIAPSANKFLRFVEISGKTLVGKPLVKWAETYNNALKKYRRYKTPFYALYPVTRIVAKGRDAYHGTQKYLSELKGEEVKQITSALVDATDAVTGMVGKTVSYAWWVSYDKYKTSQQRGVLSTFFELACEDDKRRELVQSSELSEIFNFQNRETYLFDEDGRVDMIEAKPEESWLIKTGKALSKKLEDQLNKLQKGIDDKKDSIDKMIAEAIRTNNGNERYLNDSLQRIESQTTNIINVRTELEKLIPLYKNPTGNRLAIQGIVTWLNTQITNPWWPINTITTRINRINNIPANPDSRQAQQDKINIARTWITSEEAIIRANTGNDPASRTARVAAETARANHINNQNEAIQQLRSLDQELRDLRTIESRLQRITWLCASINANPDNEDAIKSLTNSLNIVLFNPVSVP